MPIVASCASSAATAGSSSAATLGPSGYGKPCVTGVVSSATTAAVPRMPPATGGATMSSVGSLIDVRTSVEKESVQDGRGNTVDDTGNVREATGNSTGEPGNTPDDAGNAPSAISHTRTSVKQRTRSTR